MTAIERKALYFAFIMSIVYWLLFTAKSLLTVGNEGLAFSIIFCVFLFLAWFYIFQLKVLKGKTVDAVVFSLIHLIGTTIVSDFISSDTLYFEPAVLFAYNAIAALVFHKLYIKLFD